MHLPREIARLSSRPSLIRFAHGQKAQSCQHEKSRIASDTGSKSNSLYFRGDYVVLSYGANRAPPEGIEGIPQVGYW
ncbi:MAG TPA: hypothetical protein VGM05_08685 [Planctomycetaceae bacterium]